MCEHMCTNNLPFLLFQLHEWYWDDQVLLPKNNEKIIMKHNEQTIKDSIKEQFQKIFILHYTMILHSQEITVV